MTWTAIAAAARWRIKGANPFQLNLLLDWGFLKTFFIPVTLHMIWDGPWATPFAVHLIGLGIIGWFVVFGVVQQGLRQIRDEQLALSRARTLTAALPNVPTLGHPVLVSTDETAS